MDKLFVGFSTDRQRTVRVPEGFFEDVLPAITSVLEIKVTLYLFWRLARAGGDGSSPRMVSLSELETDNKLRSVLAQSKGPRPFAEALREGLELAVARGTLLQLWVRDQGLEVHAGSGTAISQWYLLNTRDHRVWVEALGEGKVDVSHTPLFTEQDLASRKIKVIVERPSVYALYEQNIGLLTPILAERLQDAEARYPTDWIESAFEEAVTNNKRNWRYIERILERWAAEGKQSGKDRGLDERSLDPDKYTKGKYAFLFRPDG